MIDILSFIFFSSAIKTLAPYQKLLHLEQLSSVNMSQFIEKESSVEDEAALNKELDSMEKARHAHFAEMKDIEEDTLKNCLPILITSPTKKKTFVAGKVSGKK